MEPLLSRRQAVRPAIVGIIVAGLVGVVALSMLVGHSSTTVLLQPGYIMLDDFQPWRAPPWDDRVGESPGGGDWFDQSGSFYGAGPGSQQKAIAMQGLRAVQPARQQLLWDASNSEGLDSKLNRAEKLASMREDYQDASEMSQIDQPLIGNMMENRRVRRRATAPRTQALHEEPNYEGLDAHLRRQEKLANMREEYQHSSEMSQIDQPIMGNMMENRRVRRRATAARTQALWGNGAEDYKLRREEQLGAMRQEAQNENESNDVNSPLIEDEHRSGLKAQHLQMLHQTIMKSFNEAKKDPSKRPALKAQLTMLCDEGRSHPQYWALKTELDNLDGGEDDSDTINEWDDGDN